MNAKSKMQLPPIAFGVYSYIFGIEKAHPVGNLWGPNCNTDKESPRISQF